MKIRSRDTKEANVPVAMLPKMPATVSKKDRNTPAFREAKMWLFHEALSIIMKPVMDVAMQ